MCAVRSHDPMDVRLANVTVQAVDALEHVGARLLFDRRGERGKARRVLEHQLAKGALGKGGGQAGHQVQQ